MKISCKNIPSSLNKTYLQKSITRNEIDKFKTTLSQYFNKISSLQNASEEHYKNILIEFLKDSFYKDSNEVNTKDRIDLAIFNGKTSNDSVGVICEVKKPTNTAEMISKEKINTKALQELVLYFMRERSNGNLEVKNLIATNTHEFFIFDSKDFDRLFYQNNSFKKKYENWNNGDYSDQRTELFYKEIAKPYIEELEEIEFTYFDIFDFKAKLELNDDLSLIDLYKILSPIHLLKLNLANDSNSLDNAFYTELLYIIGLEEVKESGKLIIRRKEKDRQAGALIENAINILNTEDSLNKLKDIKQFGDTKEEQLFNIALELSLTWVNRILFLKLLEGSLINYHNGDKTYRFLSPDRIIDYDEIYKLFHQVLAKNYNERTEQIKKKFSKIPYLNSSLFEISELEESTIRINSLGDNEEISLYSKTILQEAKKEGKSYKPLTYLLNFLNSYDFSNEGKKEIVDESKTIINASILGKVFEKINGYKDGSIFTPGFITMYMSRQSLRLAVVQKFNDHFKTIDLPEVKEFDELYNKISRIDMKTSNDIINSLKICDPAVGSGHFLVSCLNEMIAIKQDLGILVDKNKKTLKDYEIVIENDELIITDHNGLFNYNFKNKESQRIQETIFSEKQTIIENCLFGVDINPNSVKICRLRLWIELLKSAYYKAETLNNPEPELETLPNIDINIKCGNSLLSRFTLDSDLSKALKSIKYDINSYRGFVQSYKNEKNREVKRGLQNIIDAIKSDFRTEINKNDPKIQKLNKLTAELYELNQASLFELSENEKKAKAIQKEKLENEITKLSQEIEEIKNNAIYKNAFEWRFEFPEVLNDNGEFIGFDVVIGNPPYINAKGDNFSKELKAHYYNVFKTATYQIDTYLLFIERANQILNFKSKFTYIIPNSWLNNLFLKEIRKFIFSNYYVYNIVNAPIGVFPGVTVDALIFFGENSMEKNNKFEIMEIKNDQICYLNVKNQNDFFLNENYFLNLFSTDIQNNILYKIETNTKKLIDISKMSSGIKEYETGKGKPPQTKNDLEINKFNSKIKIDDTFKKHIKGADVENFWINWQGEFLKYGEWLAAPRDSKFFNNERLIIREIPYKKRLAVAYCNQEFTVKNSAHISILFDKNFTAKYVVSILNSLLIGFYFKHKFGEYDSVFPKAKIGQCKELPIKNISIEQQQPFIDLVDKILAKKEKGEDTTAEEREIDQLVYKLYDLTEEEIKIVEGE